MQDQPRCGCWAGDVLSLSGKESPSLGPAEPCTSLLSACPDRCSLGSTPRQASCARRRHVWNIALLCSGSPCPAAVPQIHIIAKIVVSFHSKLNDACPDRCSLGSKPRQASCMRQ